MQGTLQFRRLLILESCHISKVANGDDFFGINGYMKKLTTVSYTHLTLPTSDLV